MIVHKLKNILVTGGCGFIGSAFIRYLFTPESNFTGRVVNLDALTYAANLNNVKTINDNYGGGRYFFVKANILDSKAVECVMRKYNIDTIVHFAAESHVDRSITSPAAFMQTNVIGTYRLLECARLVWLDEGKIDGVIFHHVSTDEVYGDVLSPCTETSPLFPSSPYSASKAASDHLCLAWHRTYNLPVTLTRASNNYGPYQYSEKFLPLMIEHIQHGLPLPIYGNGQNKRDWVHVEDHVRAIWAVLQSGRVGEVYNVSSGNIYRNIDLLHRLINIESTQLSINAATVEKTIRFVPNRLGHDLCYSMDSSKIRTTLGWQPKVDFESGLIDTVKWYTARPASE